MLNRGVTPQIEISKRLLSGFRFRVLSLFDLQFILVTGVDRNELPVTFGELVNILDEYRMDFCALAEMWGLDNPLLVPVKIAIEKVEQFENEIKKGALDPKGTVNDLLKTNPDFIRFLAIEISKSLHLIGEHRDATPPIS